MARVFIGVGGNLGDRHRHLADARDALARLPDTRLVAFSTIRQTAPVGPIEQPPFLNVVAELDSRLDPFALRQHLVAIERHAGREPMAQRVRWGPRALDLDLLFYDDRVLEHAELHLPHPRLHERRFVLEPLAELAPDFVHPLLRKTVAQLLANLEDEQPGTHAENQ